MIKEWILKRPFVLEALREAEIKAFPKAHKDILDTMADDLDAKAKELADKKLNDLLSPTDLHCIVTLNKQAGAIYIGGERVDEGRLANLKSEAEYFEKSDLWKLLYESPKELAQRAMFVAGESVDDMKKGRSILYTLSSQKNILETFKSYKPKPKLDTIPKMGV